MKEYPSSVSDGGDFGYASDTNRSTRRSANQRWQQRLIVNSSYKSQTSRSIVCCDVCACCCVLLLPDRTTRLFPSFVVVVAMRAPGPSPQQSSRSQWLTDSKITEQVTVLLRAAEGLIRLSCRRRNRYRRRVGATPHELPRALCTCTKESLREASLARQTSRADTWPSRRRRQEH